MVSQKRKAISAAVSAGKLKKAKAATKEAEPTPAESNEQKKAEKKSKAASKKTDPIEVERLEKKDEKLSEKASQAKIDKDLVVARKLELKVMLVDDLKALLLANGLETGKKEDMILALSSFEAKARAAARDHEAKVREVVVKKKGDLEALAAPDLKDTCDSVGIKGLLSKNARVEQYLAWWQQNNGVDKALAQISHNLRQEQLCAMDRNSLRKLCDKVGANPFVKEVMMDRILRAESAAGRFSRPTQEVEEAEHVAPVKKVDMVDALLAMEAQRKKAAALKAQQEEAAALKRNEFRSMNVDQLKKALLSKGLDATGKKEDMVEALFEESVQEDAVSARKTKLRSLSMDDLKKLCLRRRLLQDGKRDDMVEAIIAQEARNRQDIRAYAAKLLEVMAGKKEELEAKTNADLKELLSSQGLAVGRAKDDWVESLLNDAKESGEIDARLAAKTRDARRVALLSMDEMAMQKLCSDLNIDPLVKEVIVERIIAAEKDVGAKPVSKRVRASQK